MSVWIKLQYYDDHDLKKWNVFYYHRLIAFIGLQSDESYATLSKLNYRRGVSVITGELKSQVDKIWDAFWTGGISNPLTVIEQFTFLLFLRRLDESQLLEEKKANMIGGEASNPTYQPQHKSFRWHTFKHYDPESMFNLFTKEVAPEFRTVL